ncbi:MAG: hypothetical protein M0R51_05830 [Clostridia bacterium]|jgi:Mg/Co/Ni transporter MgtE|nr:hypothetical protein [Clostridia bacterium]
MLDKFLCKFVHKKEITLGDVCRVLATDLITGIALLACGILAIVCFLCISTTCAMILGIITCIAVELIFELPTILDSEPTTYNTLILVGVGVSTAVITSTCVFTLSKLSKIKIAKCPNFKE